MALDLIGVIIPENKGNPIYFLEILKQQGYFFEAISLNDIKKIKKKNWKILIIVGPINLKVKEIKYIEDFVKHENLLIIAGNVMGLDDISGVNYIPPGEIRFGFPVGGIKGNSIGEGYLSPIDPILKLNIEDSWLPLHGFGCVPLEVEQAEVIAEYIPHRNIVNLKNTDSGILQNTKNMEKFPAITKNIVGKGMVIFLSIDLPLTNRRIQEGRYIEQDGIPPMDGMAPIDDGILKAEDGLVLDWTMDRRIISPSHKVPAFMVPVADVWRLILSNLIDYCADFAGLDIEKVAIWPNNADFVMHISHDTDGNNEKNALAMLDQVTKLGIKTTWCLIAPGYSKKVCEKIQNAGHELAFHFDAQTHIFPNVFSLEILEDQLEETYERTGIKQFYSNKNHYTRWEKRVEFFKWLEKNGIHSDQSKGPSKCGTIGFPFGSAHPWLPMDNQGNLINCLEVSFQCQDIGLQGPNDIGPELLEAVKNIHGVSHFIFHPAHVDKPHVQKKFEEIVDLAKKSGALFMRNIDISKWYFARREFIEKKGTTILEGAKILTRKDKKWI